MFFRGSRYESVAETEIVSANGRRIRYKRARFVPANPVGRQSYVVREGDRTDLACYTVLGDPEAFWRLCDLNRVPRPVDLTAAPGRRIGVPGPDGG